MWTGICGRATIPLRLGPYRSQTGFFCADQKKIKREHWTTLSQDVYQSVHLYVSLTITCQYCVETVKHIIKLFHHFSHRSSLSTPNATAIF